MVRELYGRALGPNTCPGIVLNVALYAVAIPRYGISSHNTLGFYGRHSGPGAKIQCGAV
jgi:hypothetical protein